MALRKDTPSTDTTNNAANPAFEAEDEGNTATVERTEVKTESATSAEALVAVAKPAASTAVVVASNNALAQALRKGTSLDESQGVIDIQTLETMGIGAFPRVTVDQGGFSENKTKFLGAWIDIELMSWNFVTLITTGEKDNKEADKLIRSSYDHVNLPNGEGTVADYVTALKEDGYDGTNTKKYIEIYGSLRGSDKGGAITDDDIKIVQISVSPQSVKQFQRFLLESKMKAFQKKDVTNKFRIGSERVTQGSNTYGVMNFGIKVA